MGSKGKGYEKSVVPIREQGTKTNQRQIQRQLRNTKGLSEDRENTF